MNTVVAPAAPGALGHSAQPREVLTYLEELGNWISARRQEFDQIDAIAQKAPNGHSLTPDIRLGMSLWQAIETRYQLLLTTWDSGRVGAIELDRISSQIWGRLETGPAGTPTNDIQGMSLPEATRLSDALIAQLRTRLKIDPSGVELTKRLRDLRAQMDRLRTQVELEPSTTEAFARHHFELLTKRMAVIIETSERGGDIGGLLGPLEADAATFERDLIVNGVSRREKAFTFEQASQERQRLIDRAQAIHEVATTVRAQVFPAPKYAVPDVTALGEVPNSVPGLTDYTERLSQVTKALDIVEQANRTALTELASLRKQRTELAEEPNDRTSLTLLAVADELLQLTPVPVSAARAAVDAAAAYELYLLAYPPSDGGDR